MLALNDVEVGEGDSARDRMGAEGVAADQRLGLLAHEPVGDLLRDHRRGDRHVARGERLSDGHDVRFDGEVLDAEHLAGPAEAVDHLVGDQEDAVPVAELS